MRDRPAPRRIGRDELAGLLGQVQQDGAGFEHGQRLATGPVPVDDDRHLGVRVQRLQIVERRGGIRQFAHAIVVGALAASDAAEVEAHHGKATLGERLVQREHHLVVHRAAVQRMRMQDQGDWRGGGLGTLIAAFKPAVWTVENDFGHCAGGLLCAIRRIIRGRLFLTKS